MPSNTVNIANVCLDALLPVVNPICDYQCISCFLAYYTCTCRKEGERGRGIEGGRERERDRGRKGEEGRRREERVRGGKRYSRVYNGWQLNIPNTSWSKDTGKHIFLPLCCLHTHNVVEKHFLPERGLSKPQMSQSTNTHNPKKPILSASLLWLCQATQLYHTYTYIHTVLHTVLRTPYKHVCMYMYVHSPTHTHTHTQAS